MMRFRGTTDKAGYFKPIDDNIDNLIPDDVFTEDIPDEILENETLIKLRKKWERGMEVTTVFIPFRATDEPDTFCVVLKHPDREELVFSCHRYMRLRSGGWEVSVDGQSVSYQQALKWIPSPRAI